MKVISKICLALMGALLLSSVGAGIVIMILKNGKDPGYNILMFGDGIASLGNLLFFRLFTINMKKVPLKKRSENKRFNILEIVKYFLVLMGGTVIFSFVGDELTRCLNLLLGKGDLVGITSTLENADILLVIIFAVVLGPICEELLFRKFLLDRLLPYGKGVAIWMSSLLFGLSHLNLEQLFYTIILGIICANIALKTGKVRYAVLIHMLFNLFGGVISNYIPDIYGLQIIIDIIFVICTLIIILIWGQSMFIWKDISQDLIAFNCKKQIISIGFMLYILFFILNLIGRN